MNIGMFKRPIPAFPKYRTTIGFGLILASLWSIHPSFASEKIVYRVVRQPVAQVFNALAELNNIPLSVSGSMEGTVENKVFSGDGLTTIKTLANQTRYFFAYDGVKITLSPVDQVQTLVISLPDAMHKRAVIVADSLFPLRTDNAVEASVELGGIILRGTPEFNAAVQAGIQQLNIKSDVKIVQIKSGVKSEVTASQ
jgi:hypothetical protein